MPKKGNEPAVEVNADAAICTMYVGEHVEDIAKKLCIWLTKCLTEKMSPSRFSEIWTEITEEMESEYVSGASLEGWLDLLDFSEDNLDDIYKQAFQEGADRFLIFYNSAFVNIVALRGHPSGREVALMVLKEEENVDPWSDEDTCEALGKEYLKK